MISLKALKAKAETVKKIEDSGQTDYVTDAHAYFEMSFDHNTILQLIRVIEVQQEAIEKAESIFYVIMGSKPETQIKGEIESMAFNFNMEYYSQRVAKIISWEDGNE